MKPVFSIIVPAYNVETYLPATLDSIQAQDFTAWECLCVDDGSTDNSAAVAQHYAARDNRFRLFRQSNLGVSVARNRALREVQGAWVLFLDGDDILAPKLLSTLKRTIDTTPRLIPCDMVAFTYRTFPESEKPRWPEQAETCQYYETRQELPTPLIWTQFWAWAYSATLAQSQHFTEGLTVGEDRLYAFQCILQARVLGHLSAFCGLGYRVRQSGVSHSAWTIKKYKDNLQFFHETFRLFAARPHHLTRKFRMSFIGYVLYRYLDTWRIVDAPSRFYWSGWRAHWRLSIQRGIPLWGRIGLWTVLCLPSPRKVDLFIGKIWGRFALLSMARLKQAIRRRLPSRFRGASDGQTVAHK